MQDRRSFMSQLGAGAALAALGPIAARAQGAGAPIEQVRILYGFPAGSAGDSVARRVGEKLGGTAYTRNMGVVENKPGAGGRIALEALRAAPADGSVIALSQVSAFSVYPFIYSKLTYKPEDFLPLSIGAIMHHGLAVGPAVPAEVKTLKDFLAWCKNNPDKASFGSPGAGTQPHLLGALLGLRSGIKLSHVPYRGTAPAVSDLAGGQIAAVMGPSGDFLSYYKAGKLRVLGTSGPQRNPYLPNVPTFAEQGFKGLEANGFFAVFVPAKTPQPIVDKLSAEVQKIVKTPAMSKRLTEMGLMPAGTTAAEMAEALKKDTPAWAAIAKSANIKID